MKLIGLFCVRNESWILGASLRSSLEWCDEVVVVDHASTDDTAKIIGEVSGDYPMRVHYSRWEPMKKVIVERDGIGHEIEVVDPDAPWAEMEMRQHSLLLARKHGATHIAIIDADEILSANLHTYIRDWFEKLAPCQLLEVPMLAMRTLHHYQEDDSVWSRAWLTLGFRDYPDLSWKPAIDGYDHHHRAPYGVTDVPYRPVAQKEYGGTLHLQFANKRRIVAKHWLYAWTDFLRWPNRETKAELSRKYSQALEAPKKVRQIPQNWWDISLLRLVNLEDVPWQEAKLKELIAKHGEDKFAGINLIEKRPV